MRARRKIRTWNAHFDCGVAQQTLVVSGLPEHEVDPISIHNALRATLPEIKSVHVAYELSDVSAQRTARAAVAESLWQMIDLIRELQQVSRCCCMWLSTQTAMYSWTNIVNSVRVLRNSSFSRDCAAARCSKHSDLAGLQTAVRCASRSTWETSLFSWQRDEQS